MFANTGSSPICVLKEPQKKGYEPLKIKTFEKKLEAPLENALKIHKKHRLCCKHWISPYMLPLKSLRTKKKLRNRLKKTP